MSKQSNIGPNLYGWHLQERKRVSESQYGGGVPKGMLSPFLRFGGIWKRIRGGFEGEWLRDPLYIKGLSLQSL